MTEQIIQELPKVDPVKTLTDKVNGLLELIQKSPTLKDAGYVAPDSEADHAESKSFGDFLTAVKNDNKKRLRTVYQSRYEDDDDKNLPSHVKAALAEGAGATGGYGVPTEYGQLLLNITKDFSALRRAGAMQVTMTRETQEFPAMDIETDTAAGETAFAGGVVARWIPEAGSIAETEPRFRLVTLNLHKLAAYSLASAEIRSDFGDNLDGLLASFFGKAIGASEEYAFFRGDGVGKPQGILNSSAVISSARAVASQIALADLGQMLSDFVPDGYRNAAWFIGPGSIDQIAQLVTAPLTWLRSIREGLPTTLLGWPVYPVGCLPALNTAGDILLVDPTYYLIGDHVGGMRIAFSQHFKFQTDQLAWRVTKRVDGRPMINNAITGEDGSVTYSPFVSLAAA